MFSEQKKAKGTVEQPRHPNRIGVNTKITGDILSEGDFRIDGELQGSVKTTGKVVIGKDGFINGQIECANADIEGKFTGKLQVSSTLSLKSSALIQGDVFAAKLAIEPGAVFNATCTMGSDGVKKLNNDKKAGKTA